MKRKRLLWQIYLSYLFIIFLSLLIVGWYAIRTFRDFHTEQVQQYLLSQAQITEYFLDEQILSGETEAVKKICSQISSKTNLRLTVINSAGQVLADSRENPDIMENHINRPEIRKALQGGTGVRTRFSYTLSKNMMYVAVPVTVNEQIIGVVRTAVSISSLDQAIGSINRGLLRMGVIVVIVSALIGFIISRNISRPLEQMKAGAESYAKGDFSHKLVIPDSQETASLAEAMNRMAGDLDSQIKEITQQRNEQQAVLSSMVEGVLAIDTDQKVLMMNDAAEKLIVPENATAGQVYGKKLQEVIRNTELQSFVDQVLSSRHNIESQIVLRKGDQEVFLQTHGTELRDGNGSSIGALIVLNDVTQLRRLENVRKDFVANVSHELKTPVTSIKGFVETLLDGAMNDPDDMKRFLEIIARQAARLNAIIEDLLILSKVEQQSENEELRFEKAKIKDVIQSAYNLCHLKAEQKDITLNMQCDENLQARMNPPLLEQAIVNLIDNAVKYSDNAGEVIIRAMKQNEQTQIEIIDFGCGIEKEYLPRLFERFYRVDKARSRTMGGTGLGLAIVKHIVQSHGGKIEVESEPGKGSRFTISLQA